MSQPAQHSSWLQRKLATGPAWVLTVFAMSAAFSTYFCMYAFRKPFSAAKYSDLTFLGTDVELKTALVISQVVGYTLSKFIGIKACSETTRARRAAALIGLVVAAEAALLLFAVVPGNWKVAAIFLNGLPLGMVWGLVVAYLEGRRTSELLLAGLSCSFIVASGVVKDVGRWLMAGVGVSESWMPFYAGLLFLPLFLVSVALLNQIPNPSAADEAARVHRAPMNRQQRHAFVRQFAFGIVVLLAIYFFLTAYRDFRDNYGVEIFAALGYGQTPAIFTRTELPVAFGVMVTLAALNLIRDNRRGMVGAFCVMGAGTLLLGGGTLLFDAGLISGATWMVLTGLGSYLAYVPYGSVLFDRIVASTRLVGTAVFTIMLADAFGYTGSVGIQLYRDFAHGASTRFEFFRQFTYAMAGGGTLLLAVSAVYFYRRSVVLTEAQDAVVVRDAAGAGAAR